MATLSQSLFFEIEEKAKKMPDLSDQASFAEVKQKGSGILWYQQLSI
jgi:hypothetical protein